MPRVLPRFMSHQPREPQEQARTSDVRVGTRYLSAKDAIVYLGLPSLGALYHHIANNSLPTKRLGRRYRFDTIELDRWLDGVKGIDLVLARRRA